MFSRAVNGDIELRLFEERHAEELYSLTERNRAHLRRWLPWVDQTRSPEDVKNFIHVALQQFAHNEGLHAGIWVRGTLAGGIGCHKVDWANRQTSIGYWLDASFQGQGVVTRCCRALLDYLFGELLLNRIEIRCATGNTKSCAIPEHLGFTREGVLRQAEWVNDRYVDLVVWSMLRQEWLCRNANQREP